MNSTTERMMTLFHKREPKPNQCTSTLVKTINAPLPLVWSILRRFDHPQVYKKFINKCTMISEGIREVEIISGLPAEVSRERLDLLDDEMHVIIYTMVDGDHRLLNYQSITTVHEEERGGGTVVIESYLVDVPEGNSEEETRIFVNTVVGLNHRSLAQVAESLV